MAAKCSWTIQYNSCKVSTPFGASLLLHMPVCLRVKGAQNKKLACNHKQPPQTSPNTRTQIKPQTQKESVYTSCYHSIIPDSQLLQSMCSSDNVALPRCWTMYPVPHYYAAISLKLNKIVCTCSMLRQPFPNKTQALSTASESAVNQTHPQTSLTQTTWKIIASQSEPQPKLIPDQKSALYNNSREEYCITCKEWNLEGNIWILCLLLAFEAVVWKHAYFWESRRRRREVVRQQVEMPGSNRAWPRTDPT